MRVPMVAVLAGVVFFIGCDGPELPLTPVGEAPAIRKGVCYSPCVISVTYAPLYVASARMTDLGLLTGDDYSEAHGVNDAGQIVGVSVSGATAKPVIWSPGSPPVIKPLFPAGTTGYANAINASGMIAGEYQKPSGTLAYRWVNGSVTDLTWLNPPGVTFGTNGYGMNDSGSVTGDVIETSANGITNVAIAYWPAGTSLAITPSTTQGQGNGINNSGLMTGDLGTPSVAFTWENGQNAATYAAPGGVETYGLGVNVGGTVAGTVLLNSTTAQEHGLMITPSAITDIGTLRPGVSTSSSTAYAIDSLNLIVGQSDDSTAAYGAGQSAFLWGTDFGMYRLPLFPGNGLPVAHAWATNPHLLGDSILVVGQAYPPKSNHAHATLWSVTLGLQPVLIISPGIWAVAHPVFYWDPRYTTDPTYDRYVRVVFFGGPNFNASQVDPSTLLLNRTKVLATELQDVNKDGTLDLVALYSMRQLISDGSFTLRTTNAMFTGNLSKIGTPLLSSWPVTMCTSSRTCLPDDTVTGF